MRLLALRLNKLNLISFGSPLPRRPRPRSLRINLPWEALLGEALCIPTHSSDNCWLLIHTHTHILITNYYTYTHTYAFIPQPRSTPPSLWSASLTSGSGTSAKLGCRTWMAVCQSWITSPVAKSCVYVVIMCFLLLRCFFLFSHCTLAL